MKLVELLARELKKWPIGTVSMTQDDDGAVNMYDHAFPTTLDTKCTWRCIGFTEYLTRLKEVASDQQTAIVTIAQWQAERDRQKGGEWKRHRGGDKPKSVSDGEMVEVRLRCGDTQTAYSDKFLWSHSDCDESVHITKYRVISQPQAEEVEYRGPFLAAPIADSETALEYDIEFPSGVCSVDAKTDQMETPFKWRDEVTELNAYIEKFTRERDSLIERLASEGFALIQKINLNLDKIDATLDMSDWRNWKEGDVIEVIANKGCHEFEIGNEVTVINIDEEDSTYRIEATAGGNDWWLAKSDGKFIRRP